MDEHWYRALLLIIIDTIEGIGKERHVKSCEKSRGSCCRVCSCSPRPPPRRFPSLNLHSTEEGASLLPSNLNGDRSRSAAGGRKKKKRTKGTKRPKSWGPLTMENDKEENASASLFYSPAAISGILILCVLLCSSSSLENNFCIAEITRRGMTKGEGEPRREACEDSSGREG